MKKLFKYLTFIIIVIVGVGILSEADEECYFKNGGNYDKILIKNVVSEAVLKFAKYEGASTDGYVKELTELNDSTAVIILNATLNAKNALGIFSKSIYEVKATLNCDGYKVTEINKL